MSITILDPIGSFFSLFATYLFTRASVFAWPVSIGAISINLFLYYDKGIFGHAGLEIIYLITTLYGWWFWRQKKDQTSTPIIRMPQIAKKWLIALVPVAIIVQTMVLKALGSNIAVLDASTTILALVAQWMICRKWIECWTLWFVVDAMVVVVHAIKGLPFHSLTHFLYLGFAIRGHLKWHAIMKNHACDSTLVRAH